MVDGIGVGLSIAALGIGLLVLLWFVNRLEGIVFALRDEFYGHTHVGTAEGRIRSDGA